MKTGLEGFSSSKKKSKWQGKFGQGALWVFILVCLLPLLVMLYRFGGTAYSMLAPVGQEGVALEFAFYVSSLVSLMLGFPMVISVFYMTDDVEKLLYLPVRPWQIVGAKFTISLIYTYLSSLYFLLPFLAGYGVKAGAGPLYWVFSLVAILFVPVLPLIYGGLISMVIMRLFKRAKNKDFLTVVGVILALVLALGISTVTSNMDMDEGSLMTLILEGHNSMMGIMNGIFPTLRFIARAVAEDSALSALIFLAITAAALAVFFLIAEKLYFAGAMGMQEAATKRKKLTEAQSRKLGRRRSARAAYFWKEIRLLLRSPIYFMNCVMLVFIWPLFVVIPIAIQMGRGEISGLGAALRALDYQSDTVVAVFLFVALCISLCGSFFNYVAGTAISREGKNLSFMKAIPVPMRTQLQAKLLSALFFCVLGTGGYCVIIMAVFAVLFGLPWWTLLFALAGSVFANLLQCSLQLLIDLMKPKLNWENEQQAVKQNYMVVVDMFLGAGLTAGIGFLVFKAYGWLSLPLIAYAALVCVLLAVLSVAVYLFVMACGVRRMNGLEA